MQAAVAEHPRREGETLIDWMERLNLEACLIETSPPVPTLPPVGDPRLPREPGEDS